ncbi:MAG: DUF5615 family PIN-like protein [Chloroflexi bacterium]|nr:DUF5615 family PIN-like protein [Chloroflexota bacterium]
MSGLRFLADESCDFAAVRALRAEGYDVLAVSEVTHRSDDRELMEQASREGRILLTEDKDSGWLVFASQVKSPGVILIRFPGNARERLAEAVRGRYDPQDPAARLEAVDAQGQPPGGRVLLPEAVIVR